MKPDDWHDGMLSEADHAPDPAWAAQTRLAARLLDVRSALAWRALLVPGLLAAFVPAVVVVVGSHDGQVWSGSGGLLSFFVFTLTAWLFAPGMPTLLLLLWSAARIWQGQRAWITAFIALLVSPLSAAATLLAALPFDVPLQFNVQASVESLVSTMLLIAFAFAFECISVIGDRADSE